MNLKLATKLDNGAAILKFLIGNEGELTSLSWNQ